MCIRDRNRPDLFPESAYVGKYITNPPADYDVPEEYLDDETFAAILGEAEKYLGYPYAVSYTHLQRPRQDRRRSPRSRGAPWAPVWAYSVPPWRNL